MSEKQLYFAIYGNIYQSGHNQTVADVLATMRRYGAKMSMDSGFLNYIKKIGIDTDSIEPINYKQFKADFIVSMGGDGTMLRAVSHAGFRHIPIIGINLGRLGFLADVMAEEAPTFIENIYHGKYRFVERSVIEAHTDEEKLAGTPFALNEVALLKRDEAAMIKISASVNGQFLLNYQADGLIVATPTGSTAYSLSNGGPVIAPQTHVICLTPVAPHSLNVRPIVVADNVEITLKVESRSHNFLIAIDGRSQKIDDGTTIKIKKAPFCIRLVKGVDKRYFRTLRDKLLWGADAR